MKKLLFTVLVVLFGFGASAAYAASAVTTGNVNIRSGPGVKYAKRGTIPAGYRVNVGRCSGSWCRVSSARGSGWVSARYVAFNQGAVRVYERRVVAPPLFSIHIGPSYHRPRYYRSYRSYRPYRPYYYRSHGYHNRSKVYYRHRRR